MKRRFFTALALLGAAHGFGLFDSPAQAQMYVTPGYGPVYQSYGFRPFGPRYYAPNYAVTRTVVRPAPYYAAAPIYAPAAPVYAAPVTTTVYSAPGVYGAAAPVYVAPTRFLQPAPFVTRSYAPMAPAYYRYP